MTILLLSSSAKSKTTGLFVAAAARSFSSFSRRATTTSGSVLAFHNPTNNNKHNQITTSTTTTTTTTTTPRRTIMASSSAAANDASNKQALLNCPTIPLRNGMPHPAIGFGTYKVGFIPASASSAAAGPETAGAGDDEERSAQDCVLDALNVGYRFLECAEFYGNEEQVGKAIQKSGIPRSELFICSKVWTTTIEKGPEAIRAQLDATLAALGTDYVDLYLIHWPVPNHHVEAYKTLEAMLKETPQKVRGIGVSNYAIEDIQELVDAGVTELPLVNQIEINPFLYRKNTIAKCQELGIVLQSYRSLRDGKAMQDPTLLQIANKHSKSAAQILGKWCVQKGFVYVPKSVKIDRMKENAMVFDFELDDQDLAIMDNLTTPDNLQTFLGLYRKCVNRDTSKDGTMEGVKMDITVD